ncbi:hypothetical protein SAMN05444274_101576 [Mariniphaga anaerophila]|uniref:Uncharacterized protein n=1 Tax=Mariniphaga anaerophila TaxID=1484053 RepID=A0A1M4U5L4_9BACT|nr:hypothetical protein SAMN05444274_101576 [Mariniphaga anaerophila]
MIETTDLYCIAYGCPKNNRNNDCPLLEIEHLSFTEKKDWIDKLDKESEEFILKHHSFCTKRKITKQGKK